MCGIAGIFDGRDRRPVDRPILEAMTHSLVHRGPDEFGFHVEDGLGLGHRRLSIIDLASGQQPMASEDGQIIVSYNGEIYNFQSVAEELKAKGYRFRTNCDTEVILYAWAEWGPACVEHFRGMFAFALWDRRSQTLFLARDRLGIKPLYYAPLADGQFVFGSELKALLAHPGLARTIDVMAVEDYLAYGYIPDPKTIYAGVFKLPPGHLMVVRRGQPVPAPRCYWDLDFTGPQHTSGDDLDAELIERLRQAVDLRMIADVPLGAFLSGGVDSSSVVAMMAGLSDDPVNTCSIAFDQKSHDESAYAQTVAQRYRTDHVVRVVNPDDFDLVDRLADLYDEPFADSSAMPTYRVCELARERVTVALSGDGGDELFAGYRRHRWHAYEERVRSRLPQSLRAAVFGFLGSVYPKMDWAPRPLRAKSTLQALGLGTDQAYFHTMSLLPDSVRSALFTDRMKRDLQGYHAIEVFQRYLASAPTDDPLSQIQYLDFKTYLPGDILTKVDRASMAHSLEVRVPILDHEFIGWAARIPPSLRLTGREGKYIFKRALEPYLPNNVLYRPKMGFAVPIAAWFRGPLKQRLRDALASPVLADTGMFDMAYLKRLLDQHQSGMRDWSSVLWAMLMFESSLRRVLNNSGATQTRSQAEKQWA